MEKEPKIGRKKEGKRRKRAKGKAKNNNARCFTKREKSIRKPMEVLEMRGKTRTRYVRNNSKALAASPKPEKVPVLFHVFHVIQAILGEGSSGYLLRYVYQHQRVLFWGVQPMVFWYMKPTKQNPNWEVLVGSSSGFHWVLL